MRSRCVDTEALCVLAGKLVWSVRVELRILDNGGNATDVASIAAVAALRNYRRKEVTVSGDQAPFPPPPPAAHTFLERRSGRSGRTPRTAPHPLPLPPSRKQGVRTGAARRK